MYIFFYYCHLHSLLLRNISFRRNFLFGHKNRLLLLFFPSSVLYSLWMAERWTFNWNHLHAILEYGYFWTVLKFVAFFSSTVSVHIFYSFRSHFFPSSSRLAYFNRNWRRKWVVGNWQSKTKSKNAQVFQCVIETQINGQCCVWIGCWVHNTFQNFTEFKSHLTHWDCAWFHSLTNYFQSINLRWHSLKIQINWNLANKFDYLVASSSIVIHCDSYIKHSHYL